MRRLIIITLFALSACVQPSPQTERPVAPIEQTPQAGSPAARQFIEVTQTVTPIARRECRARRGGNKCDFTIVLDTRPNRPPNAYQTEDKRGRPILIFTPALISSVRNADELAFVVGHEAAHHILRHLEQTRQSAMVGALVFSGLASMRGATPEEIRKAQQAGALIGARTYSKEYELEADQLGAIITRRAGYDPLRGAGFFDRLPNPGNRFLGTHPPHSARKRAIRQAVSQM